MATSMSMTSVSGRFLGGFLNSVESSPGCSLLFEGGCQGTLAPPPSVPRSGSRGDGFGNVRESTKCKKGFVKKEGKCVKKKASSKKKHRRGTRR